MLSFREIKRRAREALHSRLRVPAIYIPDPLNLADPAPWEVNVRVHTKVTAVGDVAGTSYSYAERREEAMKIVFWASEARPQRGAVVSVGEDEAYQVEAVDPPDGQTITAFVVRLSGDDLIGLPTP